MSGNLLSWLSLGLCTLLAVAHVALYLDRRGQRRALRAAQATMVALQQRVEIQREQLGVLAREVAIFGPRLAPRRPFGSLRMAWQLRDLIHDTAIESPVLRQIPSGLDDQIAERFLALCEASEARGEPALHCQEQPCVPNACCDCECEGCLRASVFLRRARDPGRSKV